MTPYAADPSVTLSYDSFLASKGAVAPARGWELPLEAISGVLFPFQRQLVQWAVRKGRSALFADTGLGKTLMQVEWARLMRGNVLIVAPLAVAQQTVEEAKKLGVTVQYVRHQHEVSASICITNYEMVEHMDPAWWIGVCLDESSILKSVDGKTKDALIAMFDRTPYRLACTATPAPNDIAEFANHAEFLGVCTREEMLSMFFVHDEEGWRLKGHARQAFYKWMATWAMMLKRPSDIGFSDDGYLLPYLRVEPVILDGNAAAVAQAGGRLFDVGLKGITGRAAARKATLTDKVQAAARLVNETPGQWLVWHFLNDEGRDLLKLVPDAVLVEGQDTIEHKVSALSGFAEGRIRVLVTKPSIAGWGLNLQACHQVAFVGLTDSYESYYQAIRRCWRFGQKSPVDVRIILSDIERPILENIQRKESQAEEVSKRMVEHVSEYQREELGMLTVSRNGYHTADAEGEGWRMLQGDCVERLLELEPESVDFSVFSPPFLSLYTYSDSERDMGNSRTESEFFDHFAHFVAGLLRVVKPGRNVACHVAQVPATLVKDGFIGLKDFRGQTIEAFRRGGFVYHGEVVIDKDPQAQAIRTHSKGLLFVQLKKDSSWLRPGLADYILVFRKPGENAVPIKPDISNNEWIEWARPIWYGIRESDTLHVAEARSEQDERHIAPLQLGTIERCIRLWSNKGELVLSPFAGIGSEGYVAVQQGRRFVGIELKPAYVTTAIRNLEAAVMHTKQGKLL